MYLLEKQSEVDRARWKSAETSRSEREIQVDEIDEDDDDDEVYDDDYDDDETWAAFPGT